MRRIQKILFGTFLGGVLLCGVGAGTALVEYSSFTYAGEKKIGWEDLETKNLDFSFDRQKGSLIVDTGFWDGESAMGSRPIRRFRRGSSGMRSLIIRSGWSRSWSFMNSWRDLERKIQAGTADRPKKRRPGSLRDVWSSWPPAGEATWRSLWNVRTNF